MVPNSQEVRSLEFRINFPVPFEITPEVMITPICLDMDYGYPVDWHIDVYKIDKLGFSYKVTTNL
jgi:hypothetical protein